MHNRRPLSRAVPDAVELPEGLIETWTRNPIHVSFDDIQQFLALGLAYCRSNVFILQEPLEILHHTPLGDEVLTFGGVVKIDLDQTEADRHLERRRHRHPLFGKSTLCEGPFEAFPRRELI